MQLLRLLRPKGLFTWIGFIVLCAGLVEVIFPRLTNPLGRTTAVMIAAGLVLLFWKTPSRWQEFWLVRGRFIHCVVHGGLAYVIIVTLGYISQMYNLRNWWELLTLTGGAAPTQVHAVGGFAVVLAAMVSLGTRVIPPPTVMEEILIRGPSLIPHSTAHRLAKEQLGEKETGFLWGGVWLPFRCGTEHFCVVGESGGGKTKSIQMLLKSVLPTIEKGSNRRALIYDAKRDLFSVLASFNLSCPVVTLHPFDRRGWAWDIAADVTDPMIAIEIAHILIPEEGQDRDPFFPNAARSLLSGVLECFVRQAPGKWTLRDAILALRYKARTEALLETSEHTLYLKKKYLGAEKTFDNISSTLENRLRRLAFVAAAWERAPNKLSLAKWVDGMESVLLLGSSPRMESTFREVNRAIVHRLSQLIREQGEADRQSDGLPPRQTWVVIDELREAGRMEGLAKLLVEGRSKGACVVLGFQDLPGLQSVYGVDIAAEIVGLCSNKAFLRSSDPSTQSFASKNFGERETDLPRIAITATQSTTRGKDGTNYSEGEQTQRSYERRAKPLILPSQFRSDLPRPNPSVGLSGFYQTALVGEPYYANLPGDFVGQMLPGIDYQQLPESAADFLPRYTAEGGIMTLEEWTEADLARLNLAHRVDLLETETSRRQNKTDDKAWKEKMP